MMHEKGPQCSQKYVLDITWGGLHVVPIYSVLKLFKRVYSVLFLVSVYFTISVKHKLNGWSLTLKALYFRPKNTRLRRFAGHIRARLVTRLPKEHVIDMFKFWASGAF